MPEIEIEIFPRKRVGKRRCTTPTDLLWVFLPGLRNARHDA